MRVKKRIAVVASLAALLLAALPGGIPLGAEGPAKSYAPQTLYDLQSVEELRALFNQEKGRPRLVLLLSPT